MKSFLSLIFILLLLNCTPDTSDNSPNQTVTPRADRVDYHSYSQPQNAQTKHLDLQLNIDFDNKKLLGFARWEIENNNANEIIFDARDLQISKVTTGEVGHEKETKFTLTNPIENVGSALKVKIKPTDKVVTIYYSTTPGKDVALDWIDANLTADKKLPFVFTQGQAILTRSWLPCQDSPGIRITYNAEITVPKGFLAVMSAENPQTKNETGIYSFKMEQPIPSYLVAMAAGDLEFVAISERTGVYAEPSVVKAAAYEFGEMEKMVGIAENLYGKYDWERFDVIVLPPSFPFGGMENPRLTFATPTIIAGDRSLTSLIAHELAHSWSGNLVTNATWNDFWLNEGFTVYFERRIMEELSGKDYEAMLSVLGFQDLEEDIKDLGPKSKDTHLFLNLEGRDPDEGMTDIAYEKGAFFLQMLEKAVGRENFDKFLNQYFAEHKFQTITTNEFIDYLKVNLIDKYELNVNIDEWIFAPGIPESMEPVTSERFAKVDDAVTDASKTGILSQNTTENWTTHEWLHFIRKLPRELSIENMNILEKAHQLSQSGNSEILAAWFDLSIRTGHNSENIKQIEAFLVRVGRRKFLTPLYRAFKESGQLGEARRIYTLARPNYHSVSKGTIDALLEI
jgi:aminopeptidase N